MSFYNRFDQDIRFDYVFFSRRHTLSLLHWGKRDFFIGNLLFQIHLIIGMILVDLPCAMEVYIPFSM
jgi:hypothetical protein